jgi:hypothetical protein
MAARRPFHATRPPALLLLTCLAACGRAQALPEAAATAEAFYYDQVSARIPRDEAPIASVAMARLIIALHSARKLAAQSLCNGNWPPAGQTLQRIGPFLPPTEVSEDSVWIYQSLQRAHPLACGQVSRARFFQEMSRHLPAWISIRPAGQTTVFNQGAVQARQRTAFARR